MAKRVDLHVRIPADLKKEVQRQAQSEYRSLNEQIVVLLQRAVSGYRQLHRSSP